MQPVFIPIPAIVITVLAMGFLLGGIIWLVTAGRKPHLPHGLREDVQYRRHKITVVFASGVVPEGIDLTTLAYQCGRAVWSAVESWRRRTGKVEDDLDECCVFFATNDTFDLSPYATINKAAAYTVYTGASLGAGIPMLVLRERLCKEVMDTGEPVIHECMHVLLGETTDPDKDPNHDHAWAWIATAGKDSIQAVAQRLFGVS